jgi:hypothetical protein
MFDPVKPYLKNLWGWKTSKKIIVIQSDDWGAQRTSSPKAFEEILRMGIPINRCHYGLFDSLERNDDLIDLFETLQGFKDSRNIPVKFTANCLMANPNYEQIRSHDYERYFYEPVADMSKRYPRSNQIVNLWKIGLNAGFFIPQLHGREHLQTERWLKSLQERDPIIQLCFEHEMYGVSSHLYSPRRKTYLAALDYESTSHRAEMSKVLSDAIALFHSIFGFNSASFIPPNYVWDDYIESILAEKGVGCIQSAWVQRVSEFSRAQAVKQRHYQGQRNSLGQIYIVRNVEFEPASNFRRDWVTSALSDIAAAFMLKTPAVISTHRVNYVGHLSSENRKRGLGLLSDLLTKALQRWPELEFWTTDELAAAIRGN